MGNKPKYLPDGGRETVYPILDWGILSDKPDFWAARRCAIAELNSNPRYQAKEKPVVFLTAPRARAFSPSAVRVTTHRIASEMADGKHSANQRLAVEAAKRIIAELTEFVASHGSIPDQDIENMGVSNE